jgi:hypothetical protein
MVYWRTTTTFIDVSDFNDILDVEIEIVCCQLTTNTITRGPFIMKIQMSYVVFCYTNMTIYQKTGGMTFLIINTYASIIYYLDSKLTKVIKTVYHN